RRVVVAADPEAGGHGSLPDHVVAHRDSPSAGADADPRAGALWRQVADPVSLDDNPKVEVGRVDPVGPKIHQAVSPGDAVDDIVDNVAVGVDAVDGAVCGRTAAVGDDVAPDDAAGAAGIDADKSALVEQIVLDDTPLPPVTWIPREKPRI